MKTFKEIEEGVFLVSSGRANSYLLSADDLVLVDAGMPGEADNLRECIEKTGRNLLDLTHILITHAHMDHIGSLAAIKRASGAKVVAGSQEVDYIEGLKKTWTMGREGLAGTLFRCVLYLLETFSFNYQPATVDIPCRGGEFLECSGGLRVIASPGHSPGSLSYYHPERKILFTGDALSGGPEVSLPPKMGCANYRDALQTVERLVELDCELCLFGHGDPLRGDVPEKIRRLLNRHKRG